jgi:hypothetical protein
MADNSYAQLIDDFEAGINVLEGETLTEYIKRMGGVDYNAHGGSVGIEVLFGPKRKEFKKGGRGRQDPMGGFAHQTAAEMRSAAPDQFGGGMNISHGGGDGGNNQNKTVYVPPEIKEAAKTGLLNLGLKKFGLSQYLHPALAIKGVYNMFKNPEIKDEDVTLGKTSEVISDLPSDNLFAEVTDIDLKRAKEPMTKTMDYDTYKTINPGSKISPYEFDELKKGNITETGTFTAADGGRVGFQSGGSGNWWDGLTGEAKGIYDSMTAYGASDAEIQSKLQAQNLWSPDGTTDTEQVTGIINQNIGGDDKGNAPGQGILDLTFTEGAVPRGPTTDFNINPAAQLTGKGRIDPMGGTYDNLAMMGPMDYKTAGYHMSEIPGQEGYEAPSKYFQEPSLIDKGIGSIKDFFSGLGTPRVRGTLGTRLANQPRIPFPAAMASWSRSPFNKDSPNYNEKFVDQLNFLEMQDNMIGRDQGSGLLRYGDDSVLAGKNVISMFGTNDYETMLNNYIQKMNANKRISDTAKAAKIAQAKEELAALLAKQEADKKAAQPKWTPPAHHSEQGGGGYQDAPIYDIKDEGPGVTASSGMHGGRHYNTGGLATMFTRRR